MCLLYSGFPTALEGQQIWQQLFEILTNGICLQDQQFLLNFWQEDSVIALLKVIRTAASVQDLTGIRDQVMLMSCVSPTERILVECLRLVNAIVRFTTGSISDAFSDEFTNLCNIQFQQFRNSPEFMDELVSLACAMSERDEQLVFGSNLMGLITH